jgi:hypothetical protein
MFGPSWPKSFSPQHHSASLSSRAHTCPWPDVRTGYVPAAAGVTGIFCAVGVLAPVLASSSLALLPQQ